MTDTLHEAGQNSDLTDAQAAGFADFDAFWREQDRKGVPYNVFGVVGTLPTALPLRFELEARKAADSESPEDVAGLVSILFGEGALDEWTDKGMNVDQFSVVLMWAVANVGGEPLTIEQAYERFKAGEARKSGKTADPLSRQTPVRKRTSGASSSRGGR